MKNKITEKPSPPEPPEDRIILESGPLWPWLLVFGLAIIGIIYSIIHDEFFK